MKFTDSFGELLESSSEIEGSNRIDKDDETLKDLKKSYALFSEKRKEVTDRSNTLSESEANLQFEEEKLYEFAEEEISEIDYSAEELRTIAEQNIDHSVDGVFLSAAVNNLDDDDIVLPDLEGVNHVGLYNTKEIVVEGSVGDQLGRKMKAGSIEVKEDSGEKTGDRIKGGELRIHGEVEGAWGYGSAEDGDGNAYRKKDGEWVELGYTMGDETELHEAYNKWRELVRFDQNNFRYLDGMFEKAENLVSEKNYSEREINDILKKLKDYLVTDQREKNLREHTGVFISAAANQLDSVTIKEVGEVDHFGYRNSTDLHIKSDVVNAGERMESGELILDGEAVNAGRNMTGGRLEANQKVSRNSGYQMEGGTLVLNGLARKVAEEMSGGTVISKSDVTSLGKNMTGGTARWQEGKTAKSIGGGQKGGNIIAEGETEILGASMEGGELEFEGEAEEVAEEMEDGKLRFIGDAEILGENMTGGDIIQSGGKIEEAGKKQKGGSIDAERIKRAGERMDGGEISAEEIKTAGFKMEGGLIDVKERADVIGTFMEGGKVISRNETGKIGQGMKGGEVVAEGDVEVIKDFNDGEALVEGDVISIEDIRGGEVRVKGEIGKYDYVKGDLFQLQDDEWKEIGGVS